MQKIILYIQPQLESTSATQDYVRVDLMESDLISLTQVIQDVRSIDKIFTDYSKTFNLPASKTNNKIFKYWYNPDVEGFDNQVLANARIELNHFAFKEGKIRLESVTMRNNQPSMYKITFFGNTVTLNDLIGEDKLESLEWLSNFNHDGSDANIKNGLEFGLNFTIDSTTYNDAIIYPLIAHSQQYIYDATNNTDSGLNISTNTTEQTKRGVFPEDLKPAILVKHIIKAIEEKYSITFKTSEFFDSTTMDNFYLWLHRNKGKMLAPNNRLVDDVAFTCTSASVICNTFDGSLPDIEFHTDTGIYEFYLFSESMKGRYDYDATITPESGSASTAYTAQIINLETNEIVSSIENVTGTQTVDVAFGYGTNNPLEVGVVHRLAVKIITNTSFSFDLSIDAGYRYQDYSVGGYQTFVGTFTSNPSSIDTVQDIEVLSQIPDMKILDFLNGLFKMFNLTAFVNFGGEIVVQTLDDFYDSGDTHDITKYVKTDEHNVSSPILNEIDLEYVEPKSILAQQFLKTNNRRYGEIEYKTNATKKNAYKVTAPFEHMLYSRLSDLTSGANTDVQNGCFLNEELEASIGQPLLFYGISRTSISTGINFAYCDRPATYGALADATGFNFTLTEYWMPHHANELGTSSTPPSVNLNFGSEINTYTLTDYGGNTNSLFQENYENYIVNILSKKARIYRFTAVLPLKVLLELSLDDKIIIGTRLYKINSMTTKLQSGETEFELINIITVTPPVSVSYSQSSYCTTDSDPTPTVEPSGGTFTAV